MTKQRKPNRSDKYQHVYKETAVTDEFLSHHYNVLNQHSGLNPYAYDEEERVYELKDQLKERFWELAKIHLTDKQFRIARLQADGYNQAETAAILGYSSQSSVCKTLNGNAFYGKSLYAGHTYGGIIKKMQRVVAKDPKTIEILAEIAELEDPGY